MKTIKEFLAEGRPRTGDQVAIIKTGKTGEIYGVDTGTKEVLITLLGAKTGDRTMRVKFSDLTQVKRNRWELSK